MIQRLLNYTYIHFLGQGLKTEGTLHYDRIISETRAHLL